MGIFDKLFGNSDIKKRPWVQYYTKEEKKLKITDKTITGLAIKSATTGKRVFVWKKEEK